MTDQGCIACRERCAAASGGFGFEAGLETGAAGGLHAADFGKTHNAQPKRTMPNQNAQRPTKVGWALRVMSGRNRT